MNGAMQPCTHQGCVVGDFCQFCLSVVAPAIPKVIQQSGSRAIAHGAPTGIYLAPVGVPHSAAAQPSAALPSEYAARKDLPLWTFMFEYFPLAWLEVVKVAVDGDKQHGNTGKQIHWAREKSTDQLNTAFRHQFDYGTGSKIDTDGRSHLAKAVWRLMAQLQLDIEEKQKTRTSK